MSKYTPTTEYVRDFYAKFTPSILIDRRPNGYERAEAEFDRWLAEHDREVAAGALRDAAGSAIPRKALAQGTRDWLRARADQIKDET